MIVGIDEAGRGPLAGIVSACALTLKSTLPFPLKDSKELDPLKREEVFLWLEDNSIFCVGISTPKEIDRMNILEATFLACDRAIRGLLEKVPNLWNALFIIDGNVFRTKLDIKYKCIKGADKKIKEVACASIVAKVVRDYLMKIANFLFPEWNFSKHKGYPTKEHFSLIKKYYLSPLHRRTFFPCNNISKKFYYAKF